MKNMEFRATVTKLGFSVCVGLPLSSCPAVVGMKVVEDDGTYNGRDLKDLRL